MPNTSKIKDRVAAESPSIESALLGRILTSQEAADILRISVKLLLSYIASGQLPASKLGRGWRILEADLQRFYEGQRTAPTPELVDHHGRPHAVPGDLPDGEIRQVSGGPIAARTGVLPRMLANSRHSGHVLV